MVLIENRGGGCPIFFEFWGLFLQVINRDSALLLQRICNGNDHI